MSIRDERLAQILPKVERAKHHIRDLESAIKRFFKTNPYIYRTKRDPETRQLVYYVTEVGEVPGEIPLIAGDAIQNLMSALDHLAYQLCCADSESGVALNADWTYFPIRNSREEYESRKRRKMKGALDETFEVIDALKPYKGGNEALWVLYRLNNIEKHRLLFTVGSHVSRVTLPVHGASIHIKTAGGPTDKHSFTVPMTPMKLSLAPPDRGFPLKAGFELYRGGVDEKPNPNLEFGFSVAIYEPGVIESKAILVVVQQLLAVVERVITTLHPRLSR